MGTRFLSEEQLPRNAHGWLEIGHLLGIGVRLLITNRIGGVSEPPFNTMNLSAKVGDDPSLVRENRCRLAQYLGRELEDMAFLEQVHGTALVQLGPDPHLDLEARKRLSESGHAYPSVDGAICKRPGPVLCVLVADCLPLALYHPEGVGGILHAGWRGTILDIAGKAVKVISETAKSGPDLIRAVVGPGIGPCCYRVDQERATKFLQAYGEDSGVVKRRGSGFFLDLRKANLLNLERAGISSEKVSVLDTCTCCRQEYYSHRREGRTGRQGAFLLLY